VKLNAELFVEDPSKKTIPNLGVAKVGEPTDAAGWAVLRYELASFVCDGAYERGLDRILSTYLSQVGSSQPAGWVSGFYGSGKSHLVRVLEYLWRDVKLPDGSTARGLVKVSPSVERQLRELTTVGARNGGLWSAAGTLGAGAGSVRLDFLSIVLNAAGLPADLAPAQCVMWLRDEGLLEQVQADIASRGLDWDMVLGNMYVSEFAEAILAVKPGWAPSPDMARQQISNQFPEPSDISLAETIKTIEKILRGVSSKEGKLPCVLVVLDEMQQFINEDPDRAQQVQLLVEACSVNFGGLLTIVATGQAALQSTAVLQKLTDRFTVEVQLSDADVEQVIREVVLQKRPDMKPQLEKVLDANGAEIDRQLAGARIAPTPADEEFLVPDYPLLPARRRFWEDVLRSVDKGGKAGQLRTQLKLVHEANARVASDPLGTVVPADFLYEVQAAGMLQSGVLLREIEQLIKEEDANGAEGVLRSRILAMVFLISQLSREGFADTGVRATSGHIADLLVDNLASSGKALRRDVPRLLEELRSESKLMRVDDEYSLQTRVGQEWSKDFRARKSSFASDIGRVAAARDAALREAVSGVAPRNRLQGVSKTSRAVVVHFGDVEPHPDNAIPVWVRNGWDLTEKQFNDLAAGLSTDSPLVLLYLPKSEADALTEALSDREAADETLKTRPRPTTDEGQAAQKAMESTRAMATEKLAGLVSEVLRAALVVQAGGNRIRESDIGRGLGVALDRAVDRLYPRFADADNAGWPTAWTRALQGNESCLEAIGYKGPVAEHAVCKALLESVGAAGTSGNDLKKKFEAPEYGWPRDAVHAGLAALVLSNSLTAEENGFPVTASQLRPNSVGKLIFRRESPPVSLATRLAVRQVLTEAKVEFQNNHEQVACASLLQRLSDLAIQAGGPAPLPAPPETGLITSLKGLKGNELMLAVEQQRDEIRTKIKLWNDLAEMRQGRLDSFSKAKRLVAQLQQGADGEPGMQLRAVESNRQLLDDPDPIAPIIATSSDLLRAAVLQQITQHNDAVQSAMEALSTDDNWAALSPEQQSQLLQQQQLRLEQEPALGSAHEVLAAVESRPLPSWADRIAAVAVRLGAVREAAAKLLEPEAFKVTAPAANLRSSAEVDSYLGQFRSYLITQLEQHKSLVI